MFSLDAPLQPAIDGFVNPENDDTVHKTSLNTVVMQVHRKVAMETLIQALGSHLTSTDDKVRARATLLLAEVLTRLPEMPLPASAVQLLLSFFTDRLADFPSVHACLQALLALEAHHARKIASPLTTVELVHKLVQALHVPQLSQALRKQCYTLMQLALAQHSVVSVLVQQPARGLTFAQAFLQSMEGEKDPRNLLLCLQIARELMTALTPVFATHEAVLLPQYFDVVSCYFPITFTPPPNDPYGITSEELVLSLRRALSASDLLARHVVPFLLEKLASTVTEAKLDAVQTLVFCTDAYSMNVLLLHLDEIASALYHEVTKGEKKEVIAAALAAITRFAGAIGQATAQSVGGAAYAWNKFVVAITQRAVDELRGNAVDSLVSASAGHVLAAVGSESVDAFSYVLEQCVPLLLTQFHDSMGAPSKTEAALGRLLLLVDTIDKEIDRSASEQPMRPHTETIVEALVGFLQAPAGEEDTATESTSPRLSRPSAKSQRLAIQTLSHLITYPPSPLVAPEQVQQLITRFTQFLLFDGNSDVRHECLESLQAISTIRQQTTVQHYASFVMEICLAQLMDVVNQNAEHPLVARILTASQRSHDSFLKDVLVAITELCRQRSIFCATIVRLVDLCVDTSNASTPVFFTDPAYHVAGIMDAVAKIVELNADEQDSMTFCVINSESSSESSPSPSSVSSPIVFRLLAAVSNTTTMQAAAMVSNAENKRTVARVMDAKVLSACTRVFRTVMQNVAPETQQVLATEAITVFLQISSDMSTAAPASRSASLQLAPFFAAVITTANRLVRLPEVSLVINRLLELAQAGATSAPGDLDAITKEAALSAAKSLASIINKVSDGERFDALIQLLLENKLAHVLRNEQNELTTRVTALQIYVWIAKALVIRGHKKHAPACLRFMCDFLTAPSGSVLPALQMQVAQSFQLLVAEDPDVLNRKCGATITFLHRQRTFDLVYPTLLEYIRSHSTADATPALVAFSHVIASSPKAMYMPHLGSIFPLLVQAINTENRELGSSAIGTFRLLLQESVDTAKPFLRDVFPGLLTQAQHGTGALNRRDALECLAMLATIPYELIHPYKDMVLKQLLTCLNDRKRFVRHVAVRVRNQWSVL